VIGRVNALIGYVKTDPHDHFKYLAHLDDLIGIAKAAGYNPTGTVIQVLPKETVNYVFGCGKVDEIADIIRGKMIDVFIVYNVLSSSQQLNLERRLGVRVIDRYDLTLEVFERNADDVLSKMQIELARLVKTFPYEKLKASIKYLGSRPGYSASGEYAYHSVVGSIRRRIKKLQRELEWRREIRLKQLEERRRLNIPIISLAGYYGAGKTSIFNILTRLNKPVLGIPFTTLSSKYSSIKLVRDKCLIVDTIGFVAGLDPRVIDAFKLTLDDIRFSDGLILVVDVSDSLQLMGFRAKACISILKDLGVDKDRIIIAANKIDKDVQDLDLKIRYLENLTDTPAIIPCSAHTKEGINELAEAALKLVKLYVKR
jgi:GTP-binding protein HflX